jgi:phage protein D
MAARSAVKPGMPVDYYAPDYLVEMGGRELDPETKGDVLDLKVTLSKDEITNLQLTVSNWDDAKLAFKYSDTRTFDLKSTVHVKLGYAGKLISVMRGVVTSLAPQFPESGTPTLSVGCHDSLWLLKDRKPAEGEQKSFEQMNDWEIAQAIAQRNGLDFVSLPDPAAPRHELVVQKNQDDAQFLMERAKRIDFDCYIRVDPVSGQAGLVFEKPTDGRDGRPIRVYEFEWGKSLKSFSPTISDGDQVSKVTVRGWDPKTKEAIVYTADRNDVPALGAAGKSGPESSAQKQDIVVDRLVTSKQEAKALAISLLLERANEFNTGSGTVIGQADLRPGDNVELKGLGKRFSGRYQVTKVAHALGGSGFTTSFEVSRPSDGGMQ